MGILILFVTFVQTKWIVDTCEEWTNREKKQQKTWYTEAISRAYVSRVNKHYLGSPDSVLMPIFFRLLLKKIARNRIAYTWSEICIHRRRVERYKTKWNRENFLLNLSWYWQFSCFVTENNTNYTFRFFIMAIFHLLGCSTHIAAVFISFITGFFGCVINYSDQQVFSDWEKQEESTRERESGTYTTVTKPVWARATWCQLHINAIHLIFIGIVERLFLERKSKV